MGKEWFSSKSSAKRGRFAARDEEHEAAPPAGCMCAVLQLFDLNHFQFGLHQQPSFKPDAFLHEEPTVCKGLEAPRNSLELVEPPREEDTDLNIPVGVRIKTRIETKSPRESTSECSSSSPSTKTPSLVARLMGLDLLPEGGSPSSLPTSSRHATSSNLSVKSRLHHHQAPNRHEDRARHLLEIKSKNSSGTRSLPETPRVSSGRRSDVDHRLSLQFNKENIGEEFDLSAYIAKKAARRREAIARQEDENKSLGHYARQIVKQVEESASRKVGVDITNTIKSRDQREKDENEHVVLLKPRKPSRVLTRAGDEFSPTKQSTPSSSSPRTSSATLPNKNQTSKSPKFSPSLVSSAEDKIPVKPKPNVQLPQQQSVQQEKSIIHKCEKVAGERYSQRLKKPPQASDAIRNKREDPFLRSPSKYKTTNLTDKMCKKIPLSNELLNNNVQTLLPVKKQTHPPPPPAIKWIDHKQSRAYDDDAPSSELSKQLSSCSSQSYKCDSGNIKEYHQYIQRILKRTGIVDKNTPVSLAKWYSPTHPLDPAIFHHIELLHHTNSTIFTAKSSNLLNKRCNRMLIFQLVDELLAKILKPYIDFRPWVSVVPLPQRCQIHGSELIETLCWRIKAFPSANCQVLEDIDALIDKDLGESKPRSSNAAAFQEEEEEWEIIVSEIERGIVESLVHEMVMQVFGCDMAWRGTFRKEREQEV